MNSSPAITLIGMPGSGKSTLGVLLAKDLGLPFIDTDALLEEREGRSLQTLLDDEGLEAFRAKEAAAILSLLTHPAVIATGGSAIYTDSAMRHLRQFTTVVWLRVDIQILRERIADGSGRGIARSTNQSLEQLFNQREPLYAATADLVADIGQSSIQIAEQILLKRIKRLVS